MSTNKNAEKQKILNIAFLLAPGFTLMAFTGFLEVLRQAADVGDLSRQIRCRWTVLAPNFTPVKSSCGLEAIPWETYKDPQEFDYLVVVGGLLSHLDQVPEEMVQYLKLGAQKGTPLVALCTGSFILARAGLLDNKRCCVHWYHYSDFVKLYPKVTAVTDELYVIDGDRLSSPGGTSVIDLALTIVEKHLGSEQVLKSLRHLIVDWSRPPDHPQTPYMNDYSLITDPRVRKAVFLMEQNLDKPLALHQIAAIVNTSLRQLDRLFRLFFNTSPALYFRTLRLKQANWLLTKTNTPITTIALDCGFSDSSHFAKRFKDFYGFTPKEVRRRLTSQPK